MIFFYDANGNALKTVPEQVYQGSNKASRIWFVAPTGEYNTVAIAFGLPNGNTIPQVVMTPATYGVGLPDVLDENGEKYFAWFYDIPAPVTAYEGRVTIQFFIISNDEIVSSASNYFNVLRGVAPLQEPAQTDSYRDLLNLFSQILPTVNNATTVSNTALANSETAITNSANAISVAEEARQFADESGITLIRVGF